MKSTNDFQTSNREMVTISRAEYEAQQERIAELEQQVSVLMEALRLARHKRFGASSEKTDESFMEQLSFLFNEAEVFSTAEKEEPEATDVAGHKRHKKHTYTLDTIPEGVPTKQVEHRLEGEDLVCPQCGDTMTEIGKEVVKTLEIVPAQYIVREDIYYTYACPNCNKEDIETPVVKAPREKNIIPGSFATPEAIAYIMTQKFVMGSPLYRQEQEINRQGIQLSRQTMSNWILRATEDYLVPVYQRLHEELLRREVLHADETTLQVLHEPGKAPQSDSYMWLYRTSGDTDNAMLDLRSMSDEEFSVLVTPSVPQAAMYVRVEESGKILLSSKVAEKIAATTEMTAHSISVKSIIQLHLRFLYCFPVRVE